MNWFDVNILLFLNQFAHHSPAFDWMITRAYSTNLNGCIVIAIACAALFDPKRPSQLCERSELLLGATLLSAPATLVARALALSLPFRLRPLWNPALHFQTPYGGGSLVLLNWSAFPSDHATLFLALVTGIFFVSRRLGLIALLWTLVTITFPALYLGVHWPTDVIAGACLGVGVAFIAKVPQFRNAVEHVTMKWHQQHPGLFFAILFVWSYETASLFEDGRRLLRGLWHLV
jgi:undecaprenyl-diphosphatase